MKSFVFHWVVISGHPILDWWSVIGGKFSFSLLCVYVAACIRSKKNMMEMHPALKNKTKSKNTKIQCVRDMFNFVKVLNCFWVRITASSCYCIFLKHFINIH